MFEKMIPPREPLDDRLLALKSDLSASPDLKDAVLNVYPTGVVSTATHIRQFTKAVVAYTVGIALLLGAILLLPRLFDKRTPVNSQPSETTVTMPWEDPALSETDRKIREIADPKIMELYNTTDLSNFQIDIYENKEDPLYSIYYRLKIGEYVTTELVRVEVCADFSIDSMDPYDHGIYSCYLGSATENAIQSAIQKIEENAKEHGQNAHYSFEIDYEGYLCLSAELIVPKDPEDVTEGGCGDHDHLFYNERVCAPAVINERNILTNPQLLTEDEIKIVKAMWYKNLSFVTNYRPDMTINTVAEHFKDEFFLPCGGGYVFFEYDFVEQRNPDTRHHQDTIGGYDFRSTSGDTLYYYQDGYFFPLNASYGANWAQITEEQLKEIWEAYKAKYPEYYESEEWI